MRAPEDGPADKGRHLPQFAEKHTQIVRPDSFLDLVGTHQDIRRARISPVVEQDPETVLREFFSQGQKLVIPPAPPGDERCQRSIVADNFVAQINAADILEWHDSFSPARLDRAWASGYTLVKPSPNLSPDQLNELRRCRHRIHNHR